MAPRITIRRTPARIIRRATITRPIPARTTRRVPVIITRPTPARTIRRVTTTKARAITTPATTTARGGARDETSGERVLRIGAARNEGRKGMPLLALVIHVEDKENIHEYC